MSMPTSLRGANTPGGVRSRRPRYRVSRAMIASTPSSRPQTSDLSAGGLRAKFDAVQAFTVGLEEELLLLDPVSFDLTPAGPDLLAALGEPDRFRTELSPARSRSSRPSARPSGPPSP